MRVGECAGDPTVYVMRFSGSTAPISFPLALGPVWFAEMNAFTVSTRSRLILPFA